MGALMAYAARTRSVSHMADREAAFVGNTADSNPALGQFQRAAEQYLTRNDLVSKESYAKMRPYLKRITGGMDWTQAFEEFAEQFE